LKDALSSSPKHYDQYMDVKGVLEFRTEICWHYSEKFSSGGNEVALDFKNVSVVSGAMAGLYCAFKAVLKKDDEVVYFEPTFPGYFA